MIASGGRVSDGLGSGCARQGYVETVRRLRGATRCGSGLPGSGPSLECTLISVHEGRLWAWKRWSWAWACFVAVIVVRKGAWRFCVFTKKLYVEQ